MGILYRKSDTPILGIALLDAFLLTILIVPVFYFLLIRPMIRNIMGRNQAEEALDASQKRFKIIVESMSDSVFVLDADQHIMEIFGARLDEMGLSTENCLGRSFREILDDKYKGYYQEAHKRVLNGEHVIYEWTIDTPGGNVYLQNSLSPIYDAQGTINRIVGVVRDITKQKNMEMQLIQKERLAAVGEMSSRISHEFRNALTSVKMILELQYEAKELMPSEKQSLAVALSSVSHMESIVSQLLAFSRPLPIEFQLVSLNDTIQESLTFLNPHFIKEKIQVKTKLDKLLPPTKVNKAHFKEALDNVLLNALQAISCKNFPNRTGKISVSITKHTLRQSLYDQTTVKTEGQIHDWQSSAGTKEIILPRGMECALIEIKDNGGGIDPSHLTRVFEPFFTTKNTGTGLGLFMVKMIINAHRGTVKMQSNLTTGTTVKIFIPLYSGD